MYLCINLTVGKCAEYNFGAQRIQSSERRVCNKTEPPCPNVYNSTDAYKCKSFHVYSHLKQTYFHTSIDCLNNCVLIRRCINFVFEVHSVHSMYSTLSYKFKHFRPVRNMNCYMVHTCIRLSGITKEG